MTWKRSVPWKHQMGSLIKFIRMLIGAFAVIIKACLSIARNEMKDNPGWVTEQWELTAKVFYSTIINYMQNGWMILKSRKLLKDVFLMWLQIFGIIIRTT